MKRLLSIILILIVLVSVVGCAKLIETETKTVEVEVVDEYHRSAWVQAISAGKVITCVSHPAVYRIYVEYDGIKYTISGSETYYEYKDRIGDIVSGTLEIRTYDDGTTKCDIVSLGG